MKAHIAWKQVIANIVALFSGTLLARGFLAISGIVIARQIGPGAYGQYSSTMALVGLTTAVFVLGLDGWLLYQGGRKRHELNVWFTSSLLIKAGFGAIWLVGIWLLAPNLNQSSFPWILVFLGSLALWLEEMARSIWSAFNACLRNNVTLVLMIAFYGIFLGITLWLAWQAVQRPEVYMGGRLLACVLGTLTSAVVALRMLGLHLRPEAFRATLRGTLPFAASYALAVVYGQADLAIVANELGQDAAGVYAPAITLTNALILIPAAVYGVILPFLSQVYVQERMQVRQAAFRLIPTTTLVGIGLGAGLAWLSQPLILLLYGEAFRASGDVLAILGGVIALRCPNAALAAILVAVGWQLPRVGVQALSAALNVGLNFLIVHWLGVLGVAKVYVLTEAILLLGYLALFLLWIRRGRRESWLQESC